MSHGGSRRDCWADGVDSLVDYVKVISKNRGVPLAFATGIMLAVRFRIPILALAVPAVPALLNTHS